MGRTVEGRLERAFVILPFILSDQPSLSSCPPMFDGERARGSPSSSLNLAESGVTRRELGLETAVVLKNPAYCCEQFFS